jgi:hypothetical protein
MIRSPGPAGYREVQACVKTMRDLDFMDFYKYSFTIYSETRRQDQA